MDNLVLNASDLSLNLFLRRSPIAFSTADGIFKGKAIIHVVTDQWTETVQLFNRKLG